MPSAAVLEGVRKRIRPIFMTTATTVCGLSPLVFFPGAGSELYRGLGSVVLGGLVVSTIFTLFLIPTLFTLMVDSQNGLRGMFSADETEQEPAGEPAGEPASEMEMASTIESPVEPPEVEPSTNGDGDVHDDAETPSESAPTVASESGN